MSQDDRKEKKEFENTPAVSLHAPNKLLEISSTLFREILFDTIYNLSSPGPHRFGYKETNIKHLKNKSRESALEFGYLPVSTNS